MTERKANVLVVDDDEDFREHARALLEAQGLEVRTAAGLEAAERELSARAPDLVLTDLMMESADAGFVLCHRVKQRTPQVPVIVVTSVTSRFGFEFETGGGWVKADAILTKPVRAQQLRREIGRLLPELSPAA